MKHIFFAFLTIFLINSCSNSIDANLISSQSVGLLNDSTQVRDLTSIFPNDSISRFISGDEFSGSINEIEIYEKGGNKLLALTPKQTLDSTSTIKIVRILDKRFKTARGLNSLSTFKDIKDNYKISNIQNSLRNVVVSVNEINAFFSIDKNDLPAELRFDTNLKIEAIQIPDKAKIKGFFLQWN